MAVRDASHTNQRISSRLVSAGSASFQGADSPCSFVAARRSGEHGDLDRGRHCSHMCQSVYVCSVSVLGCSVELGSDLGLSGLVQVMLNHVV